MRLERVEISGFKSFYEKADLAFPGAVTAVVGPNGCGKSNICDAVAWALGEQSARLLRGERMNDVIFNGSAKRRPLGMAEVILTLSSINGDGAPENGPLRIGRRIYRDGEGEYFLNDKQVRLKDVQDRLLGTGLGVRAYSVIEQGRIEQVLSTKPQDRRRLIEEAAGITKYKLKKRLAELKLEETRGNLLRLSDIISEIERNCASLKRQASRAARYKEQSEALRARKSALARARADHLRESLSEAERLHRERREAEAQAAAAVARAEAELDASRLEATEAQLARDRLRESLAAVVASIERDEALLEANGRAASELAARTAARELEKRELAEQQARTAREAAEVEDRLLRAVAEARSRSESREGADKKASQAAAACGQLERELEEVRSQALSQEGERLAARNARHLADLEAERVAASLARLRETAEKVAGELSEREAEIAEEEKEEQKLSQSAAQEVRLLAQVEGELARLAGKLSQAEAARDKARENLSSLDHRLAALGELLKNREGDISELRSALRAAGLGEKGTLSGRLRPLPGWEKAIDFLLGADLDAAIFSGQPRAAVTAVSSLPSPSLIRADWRGKTEGASISGSLGGWEAVLENFGSLSPSERAALPTAAFVETLDEALDLSERNPAPLLVTRAGEVVRGSLLRVFGSSRGGGLFSLSRERGELERGIAQARPALASAETEVEQLRGLQKEREAALSERRESLRRAESALSGFSARLAERRDEKERLRHERDVLREEEKLLAEQAALLADRRKDLEQQERRHAEAEAGIRQRVEALSAALAEARSQAMSAAEELAHRRTEAEVAAERRRSMEATRASLMETRSLLERRIREAQEEDRRLEARAEELALEAREARQRQKESLQSRGEKSEELDRANEAAEQAASRVESCEGAVRSKRGSLDSSREARFETEVSATRIASDLEHLVAQAREEFGAPPEELTPPEDTSEEALSKLEAEAAELAASLERLGPVNILAFEEYREQSERLSFLTAQREDLERSISELQESIRKINATSSERFAEAFAAINANFREMFARLFQGGAAEMRLLDENDLLESGVEITAQPPGKRNQSILLLSGGEKALTAIGLLMAIFRYKPSPFCILDEVDATLDEANIDRFTRLLREMTEETQFIAITHNKRTMETADVMYGVTMEEPGCSKIVSVRFD